MMTILDIKLKDYKSIFQRKITIIKMVIFMFSHHLIKKENNEEILYLYIDYHFEFASLGNNTKKQKQNIYEQIKKYLKEHKINFKGHIIYLILNGIIMGTIFINYPIASQEKAKDFDYVKQIPLLVIEEKFINEIVNKKKEDIIPKEKNEVQKPKETKKSVTLPKKEEKVKEQTNKNKVTNIPKEKAEITITLHRSSGSIEKLELEEYIIGVVGAEMPASFNIEALKAQAVVARTYALKMMKDNKILTDTTKHQVYKDVNQLKGIWGSAFDTYYNKIKKTVMETKGEYIAYNNDYIEAVYHSTSNGKTESSEKVFGYYHPYLVGVDSHWDRQASTYLRETSMDLNIVSNLLGIDLNDNSAIEIVTKTNSNYIDKININGKDFSGRFIRDLLGLRSADFDIVINGEKVTFITRGYGHGVGMSQYGANGMAKEGYSYKQIISHYYPGTVIKKK